MKDLYASGISREELFEMIKNGDITFEEFDSFLDDFSNAKWQQGINQANENYFIV